MTDTDALIELLGKATQGEWGVGSPEGFNAQAVYAGSDAVANVFGLPLHTRVDEVGDSPLWAEGLINAKLIALAPDLAREVIALRADKAALLEALDELLGCDNEHLILARRNARAIRAKHGGDK